MKEIQVKKEETRSRLQFSYARKRVHFNELNTISSLYEKQREKGHFVLF